MLSTLMFFYGSYQTSNLGITLIHFALQLPNQSFLTIQLLSKFGNYVPKLSNILHTRCRWNGLGRARATFPLPFFGAIYAPCLIYISIHKQNEGLSRGGEGQKEQGGERVEGKAAS